MRPALASALALALVVAAGVASALIAQRDHLHSLGDRAGREAALVAAKFAETSAAELRLIRHVCTRDVHVERLALELAAGGLEGPDASRSAVALSRLLAAEVWLMVERASDLQLLGASGTPPTSPPSREEIGRAHV